MACSIITKSPDLSSDPPARVLCSHCEKVLTPKSERSGPKIMVDETIIEVVEKLLPKEEKKGSKKSSVDDSPKKKQEDEKDSKKKMQMKEDFGVFVTMSVIVFLAVLVTVLKIAVQSALANTEGANNHTDTTIMPDT